MSKTLLPHSAHVAYLNPAWLAWTTPGWSARRRLSYTVLGPRRGVARQVIATRAQEVQKRPPTHATSEPDA